MYGSISDYGDDYGDDYGAAKKTAKKKRWKGKFLDNEIAVMKKLAARFGAHSKRAADRKHPVHAKALASIAKIAGEEASRLEENKGTLSGDLGGILDTVQGMNPWLLLALGAGGGFLLAGMKK